MISIEQPAMVLNDPRVNCAYKIAITRPVSPDEGVSSILGAVVDAAKGTEEGKLKNLIFNCHGTPGFLEMGIGIGRDLADRFRVLAPEGKPLVERIYLACCLVARIDGPRTATDGNLFCCEIAKYAKCVVVASTAVQGTQAKVMPFGMLDRYEGTTLVYGPEGNVLSVQHNPEWSLIWSKD